MSLLHHHLNHYHLGIQISCRIDCQNTDPVTKSTHSPQTSPCCIIHPYAVHYGFNESHHVGTLEHTSLSTLAVTGHQDNNSSTARNLLQRSERIIVGQAEPGFPGHCSNCTRWQTQHALSDWSEFNGQRLAIVPSHIDSFQLDLCGSRCRCVVLVYRSVGSQHRPTQRQESLASCYSWADIIGNLYGQRSDCNEPSTQLSRPTS